VLGSLVALLIAPNALADGGPPWEFEFTAPGGAIPNPGIEFYPLTMTPPMLPIAYLELEITGLSHERPEDLNIFLLDPYGNSLEIMDDQGNQHPVVNVDLVFNDKAAAPLPDEDQIVAGSYLPLGPGMFAQFTDGGTDSWVLVVIDDDCDGLASGSFESYTLRGIPEPMTLSLLAVGAIAVVRRKRS
jgi:hypothetical protein